MSYKLVEYNTIRNLYLTHGLGEKLHHINLGLIGLALKSMVQYFSYWGSTKASFQNLFT